jgi:transposase InsO family protein
MAHILKDTFYWRNMSKTIHDVVRKCSACALLNAQRHLAHKHFRAKLFCTPRTTYGMDFHGVAMNTLGFNNILGIIDLATNSLVLVATKGRTAAVTAHNILYEIVTRKGCPLLIHSDAAQEFVSTAMKSLSAIIGCKQTTTKAHNPRGNATIERIWQFTNKCLRQMSKAQYANFHLYMPIISHVWNSLHNLITASAHSKPNTA